MSEVESQAPDYQGLNALLAPLGVIVEPAELHGILCGKLSGGASISETDWLLEAVEELDFVQPPDAEVRIALSQLFHASQAQLARQDFDLQLLLPGDDAPVERRVSCLSRWCQGFLVGFGSAGKVGDAQLSEQHRETLEDLASIARVELDQDDSDAMQAAEADYMELVEYVRMAALGLFMEFGSKQQAGAAPDEPTVH